MVGPPTFRGRCSFPKELFDNPAEADRAISACEKIDPSLTTPEAIVAAVHRQWQVKEILRTILTPRHPSQLYEAFFEGIVLFVILWIVRTRTRAPNGLLIGLFFVCYALFRIVIENFREPDATLIAGFTRGQFFSFFLIAIGVAFIVAAKVRPTFPKKMSIVIFATRHFRFRRNPLLLTQVKRRCSFRNC